MNFFQNVCIRLYSAALSAGVRIVLPLLERRDRSGRLKIRERLRLPYAEKDVRNKSVAWFHAASLGESKVLCRFVELYQRKHPESLAVLTAVSATGVAYLEKHKPSATAAIGYLPLDTIALMSAMIERFAIGRVWLMETELWPGLLWVCMRRGVAVGVVNARLEERSFETYRLFRFVLTPLLARLNPVLVQDRGYAERFAALGVDPDALAVTGNLKGFVPIERPEPGQWGSIRERMRIDEGDTVIVVGCVHADEANTIGEAIGRLDQRVDGIRWILAPRYVEEAAAIARELGDGVIHLEAPEAGRDWRVCILSAYGVLEDMYRIADAAVVGGTFDETGGHNVWEAAQFGIPVFFGPNHFKQQESCDRLLSAGVGFLVSSGEELASRILAVLRTDARAFIESQVRFMNTMKETAGAVEHLLP